MLMKKKLDAEAVLKKLAEMRKSIPYLEHAKPRSGDEGRMMLDDLAPRTEEEFEYLAVAAGLESLAADVSSAIEYARAQATEKALEVYYAAEELARDPAHADLIPHVEEMRRAYERDYGKPIPPKAKG
jgi:hypothetical protein